MFRDRPELNTAFAFESAADELLYMAGASLSVGLSVGMFPEAGVLASTVFLSLGTSAFVVQRETEPALRVSDAGSHSSAILLLPIQLLAATMVFVGAIFATAEVTVVALTSEWGQADAASFIVGGYAVGSFVVGVVIGGLRLRATLARQLLVAVSTLLITTVPLLLADTIPLLALTLFLSGIAVSPAFITAYGLVEQRVSPEVLTEGVTWVGTGIGMGMALGAFVCGWVVDAFGARNGFWVSIGAAVVALAIVALGQASLAGPRRKGAA
jgi:MFS family permease